MKRQEMTNYTLPDTRALECKLLATMMNDATSIGEVMRIVKPDMFSIAQNRQIWDTIVKMYYNNEAVGLHTVMPRVEREYFMNSIATIDPEYSVHAAASLAVALMDTYVKRQACSTAMTIMQKVEQGAPNSEITEMFDKFSGNMACGIDDGNTLSSVELYNRFTEKLQKGVKTRISTSIRTLDFFTYGGLSQGQLVILAARPSVGKTSIAMQMALHAAKQGRRATFFSLEMSGEELIQRLILSTGDVSAYELHSGNVNWEHTEAASKKVIFDNLYINDRAKSIDELCMKIAAQCQQGKCDIAFIDYLGLIPMSDPRMNIVQQIGMFTQRLKSLAKECGIPIVLLAQLNRASASDARSPQLHDLRDSGAIEADADIVLMLEHARDTEGAIIENTIWLWIRKNRAGKRNFEEPIVLRGDDNYSNFVETE